MDQVIKSCGRFRLFQTPEGFCWELIGRRGEQWYWHPDTHQWTPNCHPFPTQEEATVGLAWTLTHEEAGDLNEQHQEDSVPVRW